MKKKLFLLLAMLALVVCMLAISVSAAEPDTSEECVTLNDGTVCPLWDTDGNPLIWYVTSNVDGVKTYAYVAANDASVDYNNGWSGGDQLGKITITAGEATYGAADIAVLNMRGGVVKITSGQRVGNNITIFVQKLFCDNKNLEYAYLPLDFVKTNNETFKGCSNLKYINIEEITTLQTLGPQDFNSCTSLFNGLDIDLSSTKITALTSNLFASVPFKSLKVPTTITSIASDVFKNCTSLEAVYGTSAYYGSGNVTSISSYTFNKCYKLAQVDGLIENGILTIPEGVTTIGHFAFSDCDAVTYVEFPSTINMIYQQGFSEMSNVKLVSFEKKDAAVKEAIAAGEDYTPLAFDNCGHFRNMDSLIAISLPAGLTRINNRTFAYCDNLTAMYLPDSLHDVNTDGDKKSAFDESKKLYFVNESFTVSQCVVDGAVDVTKLALPEKPSVYFMPESLTEFSGKDSTGDTYAIFTMFRYCNAINDTIVFPEGFTSMRLMRAFEEMGTKDSPKTVVFLGDIDGFVISHYSQYITFVFANENDKDFNDLGIIRTSGNTRETDSYAYFCSTGTRYNLAVSGRIGTSQSTTEADLANIATTIEAIEATASTESFQHFVNPNATVVTEVGCTTDGATSYYCFCGDFINSVVDEEATGHNENSPVVDIYYPTFIVMGYAVHECTDCQERFNATEATYAPIFVSKGYSCTVYDGMISIVQGFDVNREALEAYTAIDGNTISYGVVATSVNKVADGNIDVVNNVDGVTAIDFTSAEKKEFTRFEIKVADIAEANWETGLYACAYVIADGAVSFISENASTTTATAKTAAAILQENPV